LSHSKKALCYHDERKPAMVPGGNVSKIVRNAGVKPALKKKASAAAGLGAEETFKMGR
jgi:hypothetical protein